MTLFRPGLAFKVKGKVEPKYLVDINREAMLRADIVLFYLNNSKTCGMWVEAVWALENKKRVIFYAQPEVRQSLYMKWLADEGHTIWLTTLKELAVVLNKTIQEVDYEVLTEITEVVTLGTMLKDDNTHLCCKLGGICHE